MLISKQDLLVFMASLDQFGDAFADKIEHLADTHEDANGTGRNHEQHEDLFLCWTADETVNGVGARLQ